MTRTDMITRVLPALAAADIPVAAAEAVACLRRGEVVGLPTETVYGLAGNALDPAAVARIFAVKERPSFDPLIVHVADSGWLDRLGAAEGDVRDLAVALARRFWPGPLTLVLPSRPIVPDLVRAGLPTVALRCSAHPVMAAVVAALGGPVAAPSANRFGRISPVSAAHVVQELGGRIPLVLDGGPCRHGLESTIVAVGRGELALLRPGPITREALADFAPVTQRDAGAAVAAPGMLDSHYAPRTPLRLLAAGAPPPSDAAACALLAFGTAAPGDYAHTEVLPAAPDAAAPLFFAALRRLDAAGVRRIYAQTIAPTGLGAAIMDRLRKAAHE